MPSAMPADLAERLTDHDDLPIDSFLDQAKEELIERLVNGKTVHRLNARDVFDCAMDKSAPEIFEMLEGLLALSEKVGDNFMLDARALANKARGVIETFIEGKPEWIEEKAADLAAEETE